MKPPINFRTTIPFFYDKTNSEFRLDPYERFNEMVIRQVALHLGDELWRHYPFQPVLDFVLENFSSLEKAKILELGCGVGRLIGELGKRFPESDCWGIDYSYQMLQQAHRFWLSKQTLNLDRSDRGFPIIQVKGHDLSNLQFGLSKAEALPFEDNSIDLVCSSFLLDRLESPQKGLEEMFRVLKSNGQMILVSPMNFQKKNHWATFYPIDKFLNVLLELGFSNIHHQQILIKEPLDKKGNFIEWKCEGIVGLKK